MISVINIFIISLFKAYVYFKHMSIYSTYFVVHVAAKGVELAVAVTAVAMAA